MTRRELARAGMLVAATAVAAQIAVPLPLGVPFTLQPLAVILTGLLLPPGAAALAMAVYVLLGAIGIPVYAGFAAGPHVLFGPTGGFLLAYPFAAALAAALAGPRAGFARGLAAATAALVLVYALGAGVMALYLHWALGRAVAYLAATFLLLDLVKGAVAAAVAPRVRKAWNG
ncbi:MAG TPA: biotin transporter BioY [Bacillota bacterium]|nr:biotin transporter BioY [Bacillota bacterium]